jgi:subtilisin family serine protease
MKFKSYSPRVGSIIALIALSAMATPSLAAQKFDAALSAAIAKASKVQGESTAAKSERLQEAPVLVRVLVRFTGSHTLDAIRKVGGTVNSVLGNIASVEIAASALGDLVAIPEVEYMEAEKKMPQRINVSVPATRADLLRSGVSPDLTGATGAGVIVGIIDSGLDFRHLDFRNTDGSTRLLGLWDQRAAGAAGAAPTGFSYGGECTVKMINDAIGGADGCTQAATSNHGTHVGSTAAGNGQQTGNGQAAYRFVGMAPKADILAANSLGGGVGSSNAVVDAVAWMKAKASALGKPLVINLSLGSYFGARDGTSNYEQALSNASGPGVVIAAAAGNEGTDKLVATGQISTGESKSVTFNWPANLSSSQNVEMWYPGTNEYAVRVIGPNGCEMPDFVPAGSEKSFTLPCGTIGVSSTLAQANNDDRQILVAFSVDPANPTAFQGQWTYQIRGDKVVTPGTPFSLICGEDSGGLLFTSNTANGPTLGILTDTSSATRTIAVAAYNSNSSWLTTGGTPNKPSNYNFGPISDLTNFSSRGPRRNCSNLAKCPAVMKPEITAPGAVIMAALSQDARQPTNDSIEADGKHVASFGTSMATPHVAGAVALMLQKNPTLTPEQVKQILFQNVQKNTFTTALPTFDPASPLMPAISNNDWGYGILDAQAAYNAVPNAGAASSYMGLWGNTNEPGWGLTITQHGNMNFAAIFTYDQANQPTWYAMSSCPLLTAGSCSGEMSKITGGSSPLVPWNGAGKQVSSAGSGTLTFDSADRARFSYTLNGVAGSKSIEKLSFSNGTPPFAVDYTDIWWNPAESGWGVALTQDRGMIFVAWFSYDSKGDPTWYAASACPLASTSTSNNGCSGDIYQLKGVSSLTDIWNASNKVVTKVGSVNLSFSDANNGVMSYTLDGVVGTRNITRLPF